MSEWQFIETIRQRVPKNPLIRVGIGDDTAVMNSHPREILVTTDTLLEGTHFRFNEISPKSIGHKSMAVNLSDIAAMGGIPECALLAISIDQRRPFSETNQILDGIFEACEDYHTSLIGGDTTAWKGPLAITVTLIGRPHPKCGPILRSGAKPGDDLFVTGPLGDSFRTGHHASFKPRVHEVKELCDLVYPTSMIDLSDGLASDLQHICRASEVGARLWKEHIPLRSTLLTMDLDQALEHALGDGEDFELCFTLNPKDRQKLKDLSFPTYWIGTIQKTKEMIWDQGEPIKIKGYEHLFSD